ncbi:MAG: putative chaperone transrane protein [Proteobacteria bacterium]|nr:putative chaperone transrane protein [Pseudomonadota bacterium]
MLVGAAAKACLVIHPQMTAASFKRYMGTDKTWTRKTHRQDSAAALVVAGMDYAGDPTVSFFANYHGRRRDYFTGALHARSSRAIFLLLIFLLLIAPALTFYLVSAAFTSAAFCAVPVNPATRRTECRQSPAARRLREARRQWPSSPFRWL